jgi:hypothetical protein
MYTVTFLRYDCYDKLCTGMDRGAWEGVIGGGGTDVVLTCYTVHLELYIESKIGFLLFVCNFFNCFVYMIFLNCVHHMSFLICMNSIVSFIIPYVCPVLSMCCAYPVLSLLILISHMLLISGIKCSSCLPYIITWAIFACQFICSTILIFIIYVVFVS